MHTNECNDETVGEAYINGVGAYGTACSPERGSDQPAVAS